ncbi:MAG: lamin tail domain-containing protein, partial [bacterium]|nr:lamin tail domain-containing protein [bacterium]
MKTIKIAIFLVCLFLFSFFLHKVLAENNILINELLIDPLPQKVEIINIGSESADISGWYIDDNGGTTFYTIPQSSILYPNSCLIFSSDFNLNKSSADTIKLFDQTAPPTQSNAILMDSFSYKLSSGSGISYYRFPDATNNWTTGLANLGLFNTNNATCIVEPTIAPTLTPALPTPTPTPTLPTPTNIIVGRDPDLPTPTSVGTYTLNPTPMPITNIFLSEVMSYPNTNEHEWIEIYNNNNFSVSLKDWYVDDIENGGSSPKQFSLDLQANSYGIYDLSSSMFNNDGDTLRLLNSNKSLIEEFEYTDSVQGKTFGRNSLSSNDFCIQEPSKGNKNNDCIVQSNTPTLTTTTFVTQIINTQTPTKMISNIKKITTITTIPFQKKPINNQINQTEVLGVLTALNKPEILNTQNNIIHFFIFNSITYSLLTIVYSFVTI